MLAYLFKDYLWLNTPHIKTNSLLMKCLILKLGSLGMVEKELVLVKKECCRNKGH
jgi:hypothetical protein